MMELEENSLPCGELEVMWSKFVILVAVATFTPSRKSSWLAIFTPMI